ncbi:PepSY domain-containing protein [Bartonella sp. HY406]|uniref:PepSY domain-containing protein n=1 Tax=Bartonella sp. HY406 TaxID=2979331 RepID=UPI0021C8B4CC|nr:PepSY domain-containing protein [Bartonella sp. HY406]UXN03010.1 PepSY domain-containing protein [Bartonella sp. HY406]
MVRLFYITVFIALIGVIYPAYSGNDQEAARQALARGEIMPLMQMLGFVEAAFPNSSVIKLEFDEEDHLYIYEFKIIDSSGIIREIEMDAKTGQILKVEIDD